MKIVDFQDPENAVHFRDGQTERTKIWDFWAAENAGHFRA